TPPRDMHHRPTANANLLMVELPGKPIGRILPASLPLWLVGTYIGLYMIRPWELMFPALAEISFQRTYALAMIFIVVSLAGIRLDLNVNSVAVMLVVGTCIASAIVGYNLDR